MRKVVVWAPCNGRVENSLAEIFVGAGTPSNKLACPAVMKQRCCQYYLWIGGSSGLAHTFFRDDDDDSARKQDNNDGANDKDDEIWILLGHETSRPSWLMRQQPQDEEQHVIRAIDTRDTLKRRRRTLTYHCLDLVELANPDTTKADTRLLSQLDALMRSAENTSNQTRSGIATAGSDVSDNDDNNKRDGACWKVLVGLRPPLVSRKTFGQAWEWNRQVLLGLERLLRHLQPRMRCLLHISSVAAIHHVQQQVLRSETSHVDPPSVELDNPYDRFKRATEEMVLELGSKDLPVTNVRLGAIFSSFDESACIQCSALQLQSRVGCFLPTRIDCNSSRNVARLLRLLLLRSQQQQPWRPVYYYTRPLRLGPPVPYGYYLQEYRRAHGITWAYLDVPAWLVQGFVALVHWLTTSRHGSGFWDWFLCLSHVNYLLQVTVKEHSFDLTAVAHDFPELPALEESICECFCPHN